MSRRAWLALAVVAALALGAAAYLAWFAPEAEVRVSEPMPQDAGPALARGTFASADALHSVSGTVTLHDAPAGPILRFEGYEATNGPDVFFYLADAAGYDGDPEDDGLKLLLDGTDGGHATKRGDFTVALPAAFDRARHTRVVVWCDRFAVEFGSATLASA